MCPYAFVIHLLDPGTAAKRQVVMRGEQSKDLIVAVQIKMRAVLVAPMWPAVESSGLG